MIDWTANLRRTVREIDGPFEWGKTDCCRFIQRYYFNMTGELLGSNLEYHTERGALKILARHGGLLEMLTQMLGDPYEEAKAGDIVVAVYDDELACGVYNGSEVWSVHPAYGLMRMSGTPIVAAWTCL